MSSPASAHTPQRFSAVSFATLTVADAKVERRLQSDKRGLWLIGRRPEPGRTMCYAPREFGRRVRLGQDSIGARGPVAAEAILATSRAGRTPGCLHPQPLVPLWGCGPSSLSPHHDAVARLT
eukprot:scaffold2458_cov121-Isochrysis_galbana.AAC.9